MPAESIYAAFEVKLCLNKATTEYAQEKIASVRRLHRTSIAIRHADGVFPPQRPETKPIIGGILTTYASWKPLGSETATKALLGGSELERLDFAMAVHDGAVQRVGDQLIYAPDGKQLIWFALELFKRLGQSGTALALDLDEYGHSISSENDDT